jgi:hypothetical protein
VQRVATDIGLVCPEIQSAGRHGFATQYSQCLNRRRFERERVYGIRQLGSYVETRAVCVPPEGGNLGEKDLADVCR